MRMNRLRMASVIALLVNAISWGLAPPSPSVASAPVTAHDAVSIGALPAWFSASPDDQGADQTTYTDGSGQYRFKGLPHGTHKVTLDPATLPATLRPVDGEAIPVLWLNPGMDEICDPLSSGVRFTASYDGEDHTITGMVFLDQDGDGKQGPNEPGLPGVRVIDPTVHQYYVPFNDENLWTLFDDKNTGLPPAQRCHSTGVPVAGTLNSSVFLIASSDGTTYYYDHWEDGYDDDALVPGATTEVGILDAGAFQIFQDNIDPTQVADTDVFFYDGRDRITVVGEDASVVRQAYPSTPDPRLGAAWEIPQVADWGTRFVATVGEDLAFNPGGVEDHDFAGLEIMAALAGTEVYYNGALIDTLGAGGTIFIDGANDGGDGGGVDSTDVITATGPIQVQMMTGACGARYSAHGYTLEPMDAWGVDYWAPVPGFTCEGDAVDSDIYLYNPDVDPINVTVSSDQGTAVIPIPSNTTISVLDYAANNLGWIDISTGSEGIHLLSADTFWGLGVIDSASNGRSQGQNHDWGYSLVPVCQCSSQVVVGYAPGNNNPLSPTDNGNLAFVTTITESVVYVDLNQDGLPDPFDMNGDGDRDDRNVWGVDDWDEPTSALGVPLEAFRVLRVGDPYDRDLTGARIYTLNLEEKIAAAWGQDPCQAEIASPYLDLGYTILPVSIPRLSKVDDLAVDADLTGSVSPGDTITYTLVLYNNGTGPMNNVVLTDSLPYTYAEFVPGSAQVTTPPAVDPIEYYDGSSWGTTPTVDTQILRITWPRIEASETVTVTFRVRLYTDIPIDIDEISNQAVVNSSETDPRLSEDPDDPTDPDTDTPVSRPLLSIDKRVSPPIVQPGGRVTYTLVVSNYGNGVALLTAITDVLPSFVEYVPGTLDVTWPIARVEVTTRTVSDTQAFHGYYADDFDLSPTETTGYTGNDGSLPWSTDWVELYDDDNPASGDVQIGTQPDEALSAPGHLVMRNGYVGVHRTADLSQFLAPRLRYHMLGEADAPDDQYIVEVGPVSLQERYDGDYTIRELDLSPVSGVVAATLQFTTTSTMDPGDAYRFDHIAIYETEPLREVTRTLTTESTVLSYTRSVDGDPASYDPLTGIMVITEGMRLPAGGFITATFQAQVQSPMTDGLTLANIACTTSSNWLEILSPPCDNADVLVQSSHALTITKTAEPPVVGIGGLLTYTLNYAIAGNEAVESMVVSDTTPVDTTFYAATPTTPPTVTLVSAPAVGARGPVIWEVSGLWPPGSGITQANGSLTMVVLLDSDLVSGTVIYNAVAISDTTELTDTDEITTPVQTVADLGIRKTHEPEPVTPGEFLTYTLEVVNNGPNAAESVVVSDTLPPEVNFVSADPTQTSGPPNPLVWDNLGTMAAGETRLFTIVVTVSLGVDETFTNTASTDSDTTDTNPDNNDDEDPASPPQPGLELVKTVEPSRTVPDMPFTYTIHISNTGDLTFNPLPLTDTLPADFYYVADSGSPSDPDDINGDISTGLILAWQNLGPLTPGGSVDVTFQVTTPLTMGTYTNTATVEGVYPGGTLTDTDDAVVVVADPAVAVDKQLVAADRDSVAPNYVTFTIGIANVGPSTIDVLPLLDQYEPSYLSFVDATPYPDEDADDGLVTWYDLTRPGSHGFGLDLLPGETFVITTVFRVVRDIDFTINTATVTGAVDVYGNPADPVEDEEPLGGIPTSIQVISFRALAEGPAVQLEWETADEWDCAGFRVYRDLDASRDDYTPVIAELAATGPGSTYQYMDRDVVLNQAYWYWLAQVSVSQPEHETFYGPVWGGVGPHALPFRVYLPLIQRKW